MQYFFVQRKHDDRLPQDIPNTPELARDKFRRHPSHLRLNKQRNNTCPFFGDLCPCYVTVEVPAQHKPRTLDDHQNHNRSGNGKGKGNGIGNGLERVSLCADLLTTNADLVSHHYRHAWPAWEVWIICRRWLLLLTMTLLSVLGVSYWGQRVVMPSTHTRYNSDSRV